ncbi:MAG: pyruvate flavodoxin/ferredoxin oxidoreductase [Acidimicrobiia bacterium]
MGVLHRRPTITETATIEREFTDGATAIVRGALDAGCNFFAGYPITPASPILMMMLRDLPARGGIGMQGEDEIASIGMCIGAAMTGARVMTASAGPGISLYSENIGMAIMGEVPLVIVDVQRLGPSTGAATTTAQGDVQFVRWGTAGGFPVIAICPSSVAECYTLTMKAFDFAERFRCPVFLMADKELALTMRSVDPADYVRVDVRDRDIVDPADKNPPPEYRFDPPDEVVPMQLYGGSHPVRFTGSTHTEEAFITKKPSIVGALNDHLVSKISDHVDEIAMVEADIDDEAETLLISYGVTAGSMREAVAAARGEGTKVSSLTIKTLWPVPEANIMTAALGVSRVVVAELNPGLYMREIERVLPHVEILSIARTDGVLISPDQLHEVII